jgi:hypothetical protein
VPSETLEQVRLPEIADVVVDAAALVPMRDQPHIVCQYQQKDDAEEYLEKLHRFIPDRPDPLQQDGPTLEIVLAASRPG